MRDSLNPNRLEKIKWLLKEVYPLSRDAIIYYEVLTGEMNYSGMSELRDSFEHIKRAFCRDRKKNLIGMWNLLLNI